MTAIPVIEVRDSVVDSRINTRIKATASKFSAVNSREIINPIIRN